MIYKFSDVLISKGPFVPGGWNGGSKLNLVHMFNLNIKNGTSSHALFKKINFNNFL